MGNNETSLYTVATDSETLSRIEGKLDELLNRLDRLESAAREGYDAMQGNPMFGMIAKAFGRRMGFSE